jgi:hypothetical protein
MSRTSQPAPLPCGRPRRRHCAYRGSGEARPVFSVTTTPKAVRPSERHVRRHRGTSVAATATRRAPLAVRSELRRHVLGGRTRSTSPASPAPLPRQRVTNRCRGSRPQPAVLTGAVKSRYATSSSVGCKLLTAPLTNEDENRRRSTRPRPSRTARGLMSPAIFVSSHTDGITNGNDWPPANASGKPHRRHQHARATARRTNHLLRPHLRRATRRVDLVITSSRLIVRRWVCGNVF